MPHPLHPDSYASFPVENLLAIDLGLFCMHCGKPVVNFSGMERSAVLELLYQHSQTACVGRNPKRTGG